MTPVPFGWSKRSCGIPFDVTFQIEENGQLHEVKAHKMILAMVSDTFKTMFYATEVGNKNANPIKIKEATASAFQIIIDAVYSIKSIEESLRGKTIHEIFDVVNLVERYQIPELLTAAKEVLCDYPITDDTLLEVAEEAVEYANIFEVEANILLLTCSKYLKTKFKDLNSEYVYVARNNDQKEVCSTLMDLMKDVDTTEGSNTNHNLVYACIQRSKGEPCYTCRRYPTLLSCPCSHIHQGFGAHGLHRDQLFRMINHNEYEYEFKMTFSEMEASLFFLATEDHIFTTIDEDHFMSFSSQDDDHGHKYW